MPLLLAAQCCGCLRVTSLPLVQEEVPGWYGFDDGFLYCRRSLLRLPRLAHADLDMDNPDDAEVASMGGNLVGRSSRHSRQCHHLLVAHVKRGVQCFGYRVFVPHAGYVLLLLLGMFCGDSSVRDLHDGRHSHEDVARRIQQWLRRRLR